MGILQEGLLYLSMKCQAINLLDNTVGLLWEREVSVIAVCLLESLHIEIPSKATIPKPMSESVPKLKPFD